MLKLQHITKEGAALQTARQLFSEYAAELQENLCFQSFDDELKDPLKKYGHPHGSLILAYYNDQPVACIALQPLQNGGCEMKRLYVQPQYRKHKIAAALVEALLLDGRQLGYTKMKLDTLERLQPAIHLYKKYGFIEATAYYANPLPGVVYMEKEL